jgi:hypothetical protein
MDVTTLARAERPSARIALAPQQRTLAWINVLGGACVLASYAWGFSVHSDVVGALWGGVPGWLRPLYTLNMLLAAAGYFLFTPFLLLRLPPAETRIAGRFGYGILAPLTALVLVPSALWMPLTFALLEQPSAALWWIVRLDLALAGAGSLGLAAALLFLRAPARTRGRALALVGLVPFCLQTAVLDALVWPAYFPTAVAERAPSPGEAAR